MLLEDLNLGTVTPAYAKSMVLPAFQNNLELCFSMHTYLGALDSYQYILEGLDERWKYNLEYPVAAPKPSSTKAKNSTGFFT